MSQYDIGLTTDMTRQRDDSCPSRDETISTWSRPTKIRPWHLERLAFVYVRQSSQYQVMFNKESAEVQANLRDLAIAWGWPPSRVILVTDDQAKSGTSAEGRDGFQSVLNEVNLDHVGIIFGFQVSRLSRANSDWYHLLERCGLFHTLLADQDGLYDPTSYNDRLLLGLKGTMSEAELHFLRQRLYHGRLNKARRGELFTIAPIGYLRQPGDRLELDPDEQVRHVVRLIFDKFDELGSVGSVLRYLQEHDIKLGVRMTTRSDAGRLDWRPVHYSTLVRILRNPYYAGCYVFGFTRIDLRRKQPGHPASGKVRVEPMKWQVMIPDKIPAYITWERYLANQERLNANRCLPSTIGVPRSGPSLLSGLMSCGRCGRKMKVSYHAKNQPTYYSCFTRYGEQYQSTCQGVSGREIEALVVEQVLRALEPAALELSLQAVADLGRERQRLDQHWQQRRERARIESERAARQYHAVEPENRLVARELERRWEQALREQRELEEQYNRFSAERPRELTASDRQRIEALASDVPGLWHAPDTTVQDRKTIIRCLIERLTVTVRGESEWVDVTIRWVGGLESRHEFVRQVQNYKQLSNYQSLRDRMVELRQGGATAREIAERLNQEGFRPPRGPSQFNRQVVFMFLTREGLMGPGSRRLIKPEELRSHEWRLGDLARELGMPSITLRHWHYRGWVAGRKSAETGGGWIFWADNEELERLRQLRAWQPEGRNRARPPALTTPKSSDGDGSSNPSPVTAKSRGASARKKGHAPE
jgi:DNA invertase Pin-like site-specific DNA recombinase